MVEKFSPFAGFFHVFFYLGCEFFVFFAGVLFVEDAVFVFLEACAAEEVFAVVAIVTVVQECSANACVA